MHKSAKIVTEILHTVCQTFSLLKYNNCFANIFDKLCFWIWAGFVAISKFILHIIWKIPQTWSACSLKVCGQSSWFCNKSLIRHWWLKSKSVYPHSLTEMNLTTENHRIPLSDGNHIPLLGLGTYGDPQTVRLTISLSLSMYTHI